MKKVPTTSTSAEHVLLACSVESELWTSCPFRGCWTVQSRTGEGSHPIIVFTWQILPKRMNKSVIHSLHCHICSFDLSYFFLFLGMIFSVTKRTIRINDRRVWLTTIHTCILLKLKLHVLIFASMFRSKTISEAKYKCCIRLHFPQPCG